MRILLYSPHRVVALSIGAVAWLLAAVPAGAAPIIGDISFAGDWAPTGGSGIADATGVDVLGDDAFVIAKSGDFSSVTNPFAVYLDFDFSPFTPVAGLWSVDGFSFDLEMLVVVAQEPEGLILVGTGTVSHASFDDTPGDWSFSGDTSGSTFAFSSTAVAVPEPSPALLLVVGLLALGIARRHSASA